MKSRNKLASMIDHIDHFVLTVKSLETTLSFYERVLGFTRDIQPNRPASLKFGSQKINVHEVAHTFEPKAAHTTPGSALIDLPRRNQRNCTVYCLTRCK